MPKNKRDIDFGVPDTVGSASQKGWVYRSDANQQSDQPEASGPATSVEAAAAAAVPSASDTTPAAGEEFAAAATITAEPVTSAPEATLSAAQEQDAASADNVAAAVAAQETDVAPESETVAPEAVAPSHRRTVAPALLGTELLVSFFSVPLCLLLSLTSSSRRSRRSS